MADGQEPVADGHGAVAISDSASFARKRFRKGKTPHLQGNQKLEDTL